MYRKLHYHLKRSYLLSLLCVFAWLGTTNAAIAKRVISEIVNHSGKTVRFVIVKDNAVDRVYVLKATEKVQLAIVGNPRLRYNNHEFSITGSRRYSLNFDSRGQISFKIIRNLESKTSSNKSARSSKKPLIQPPSSSSTTKRKYILRIPVIVYVDEEEPSVTVVWQKRFRRRIERASDIFEKTCGVRFQIKAYATWQSDNRTTSLSRSLKEFQQEAELKNNRLAIGFSSQYQFQGFNNLNQVKGKQVKGKNVKLGGIRGPLRKHLLISERAKKISSAQRLEVLVHELGHYLGASHSSDSDSVMRPLLGNRGARKNNGIAFDKINQQIMQLVALELRVRRIHQFYELSPKSKKTLQQYYTQLGKALPNDLAAKQFIFLLNYKPKKISH